MSKPIIADSSSLFALERAGLIKLLLKIEGKTVIPPAVKEEIEEGKEKRALNIVRVEGLKGKSLKRSCSMEKLGIGKGEAQCCALATKLKTGFIVCDDRKFIRQRFFSNDKKLKKINVVGFAFFLHLFHKKRLVNDVWKYFDEIIKLNNWERSEVQIANYTFLKKMGY